jgi:hypothetical protein
MGRPGQQLGLWRIEERQVYERADDRKKLLRGQRRNSGVNRSPEMAVLKIPTTS